MDRKAEAILSRAAQYARSVHEGDSSGHDWPHIDRVVRMTRRLAASEGADPFVCELAALLHDVADEKLNASKESGMDLVKNWLNGERIDTEARDHVLDIIATLSFGTGTGPMRTREGSVVRDADRLDAIGAIGIARTFAYAGWKGHPLHEPQLPPRETMTKEQYRNGRSTAINHFQEKLLRLRDLLETESARTIAAERHRFMEGYLEQFHKEWNGEC
ncbi:HD domain-containing protein [Paenibacillus hodogayensis]|uniref:HD domain-containing protein n=1 Tax=Paenibacillus hodogayensis TaxID=279208 RepID=A0ABV5VUS3_9BACL